MTGLLDGCSPSSNEKAGIDAYGVEGLGLRVRKA